MGEETGTRLNHRSAACKFPSELIREKQLLRPRRIIVAMSLTFILTATGLVYVLMLPSSPIIPVPIPTPLQLTPHDSIAIDGDADFSATASAEGWPGDGSLEDPFIINGLEIDLAGGEGSCISISNTQVNFIISNCNLTGAWYWYGINLYNVTNGELVNNTCSSNEVGIYIGVGRGGTVSNNTVANNTCNNNEWSGICFGVQFWGGTVSNNTVANNTCTSNEIGIYLGSSNSNTVINNTCTSNDLGISLEFSDSNTVVDNTCTNNRIGIYLGLGCLASNIIANNPFSDNTEHDIFEDSDPEPDPVSDPGHDPVVLLLIGQLTSIIMLVAAWKMLSGIRKFN